MSRKRNPYIPLFTHDIMSSAKCRRLSMRATGLYLWLFCLMNEKPQQGRWALSTNEDHPTWKNSLTYRALQNTNKYARLPMFATLMARKFLPWKSGEVLKALQELVRFKLIVVEDDAIIQPRMYNDNGFKLREDTMREYLADDPNDPCDDPEEDLAENYRETLKKGGKKGENKGADKGTKKDPRKVHEIHAPASRAEVEVENNINNGIGNKGVQGENKDDDTTSTTSPAPSASSAPAKSGKTQENTPTTSETGQISTNGGKVGQLSTEEGKQRQKPLKSKTTPADQSQAKQKSEVADNPPTLADVQAYADERAQQGKPFLYVTPEEFFNTCEMDGWKRKGKPLFNWKAYMLRFEQYRKDHGEPTVEQRAAQHQAPPQTIPKAGDPVAATKPTGKKYKDKW